MVITEIIQAVKQLTNDNPPQGGGERRGRVEEEEGEAGAGDLRVEHRLHHRARPPRPLPHRLWHPLHAQTLWPTYSGEALT